MKMNKWTDILPNIVTYILTIITVIALFKCDNKGSPGHNIRDTVIRTDTVVRTEYIRDTVLLQNTVTRTEVDTVLVYLDGDTVRLPALLPFERKTYATENYRLDISGYKPKLESIELFQKTKEVTVTKEVPTLYIPRWTVGAVAGIGGGCGFHNEFIGLRGRYQKGLFSAEATAAYNPTLNAPYGELKIALDLWRKN